MISSISKLLRLRIRLAWNTFKHRPFGQKIGYGVAFLGMLVFAAFLAFISWGILQILTNPRIQRELLQAGIVGVFDMLPAQLPILFSIGAFILGLFANFGVLLQGLYLSGDMEFLLTVPLPARAVFLSKLIQAILPNLALLALFSGPALYGLGFSQGYTLLYYLLVPIVLALLITAGAGLSSLLVMLVVRVVSPRRAAEVLGLVGGLTAFICSQSGQLASNFGDVRIPAEQLSGAVNTLGVIANPWNPLAWPGLGLSAIGQGNWFIGLGFTGLTLALTVVLFAVTLTFAERLYFSGWARVQVGTRKATRKRKTSFTRDTAHGPESAPAPKGRTLTRAGVVRHLSNLIPAPAWAVILKDARLYRRDIRNLSNLIFPIVLAVIWTISLFPGNGDELPQTASGFFSAGSLGIGLFMGMMFVMRFGFGGFSLEGKQWWILKTSPIYPFHLVLAKYIVALVPPSVFGVLYLIVAGFLRQASVGLLLFQVAAEIIGVAGLVALTLSFGIWGARFDWTNPQEVSGGAAGCIGSLLTFAFVGISGGIFIGLPALAEMFELPSLLGYGGALFLGILLTVVGGGVPLYIASQRIPRLGEEESKQRKKGKR